MKATDEQIEARFWALVQKSDECWSWSGSINFAGYSTCTWDWRGQRYYKAHRLSWAIANDAHPEKGLVVAHQCHNRGCVNPEHLEMVTQGKNMADAVARGSFKGENHGRSKLTAKDIIAIRASDEKDSQLARKFSVNPTHIQRIRSGEMWSHI